MPATSQPYPRRRRAYRLVAAAAGLATAGALAAALPADAHETKGGGHHPSRYQDVQLLSFNDLHGNLEPPSGSSGRVVQSDGTTVDAGGAAYLATHVKQLLTKRNQELQQGDLQTDTSRRLSELKPIVDQFLFIDSIANDLLQAASGKTV